VWELIYPVVYSRILLHSPKGSKDFNEKGGREKARI